MGRPGNCGCCCEDESITIPVATHRNLTTGEPHPTDNMLDGIEILWQCLDGDLTGLTQETVTQNCTVGTGQFVQRGSGIQGRLHNIVPTAGKAFAACQIVWTGETFDAFAHVDHIAAGIPVLYGGEGMGSPLRDGIDVHTGGPRVQCGVAIRSGGLLFLLPFAPSSETALNDLPLFGGLMDRCYDDIAGQRQFYFRVLEGGLLRAATLDELQANGLVVDPVATQLDHEVGFFLLFAPTVDTYNGDLLERYDITWNFKQLTITGHYGLNCVAAFANLDSLLLSTPNPIGTSNIEPNQFRNVSTTLTLDTLPGSMGDDIADNQLSRHIVAGYAYIGQFTPTGLAGVTVDVWYLPCSLLTFKVSDGTNCPLWFSIDHADDYSSDSNNGSGDGGRGNSTAPAFSGVASRDILWPPGGANQTLGVTWYGSDCHDQIPPPTPGWLRIDGVTGRCAGSGTSQCVQGNLPNQLPWMTQCYSLDPVAIGYRRRMTDNYGLGGVSCNLVDFAIPAGGEPDCTVMTDLTKRCNMHHLDAFGFTVSGGGSQLIEQIVGVANAVHLYFDISEP